MIDLAELRQRIKERIEDRVDESPIDGINAEGDKSDRVLDVQRAYVDGLRSARLAALSVIDEEMMQYKDGQWTVGST